MSVEVQAARLKLQWFKTTILEHSFDERILKGLDRRMKPTMPNWTLLQDHKRDIMME
jgi:hypothetical protein